MSNQYINLSKSQENLRFEQQLDSLHSCDVCGLVKSNGNNHNCINELVKLNMNQKSEILDLKIENLKLLEANFEENISKKRRRKLMTRWYQKLLPNFAEARLEKLDIKAARKCDEPFVFTKMSEEMKTEAIEVTQLALN